MKHRTVLSMPLKDMLVTTEIKTHFRQDKVHKDLLPFGMHPCQEAKSGGMELTLASLAILSCALGRVGRTMSYCIAMSSQLLPPRI